MSIRDRLTDSEFLERAGRFDAAAIMTFISVSGTAWKRSPTTPATPTFERFIEDEVLVIQGGATDSLHRTHLTSLPHKQTREVESAMSRATMKGTDGSEVETTKVGMAKLPKVLYEAYRCMSEHTGAFHPLFPVLHPGMKPEIDMERNGSSVAIHLTQNTFWAVQGLPWKYIEQLREVVRFAPENQSEFPETTALSSDELRCRLFPREAVEMSEQIDSYLTRRVQRMQEMRE